MVEVAKVDNNTQHGSHKTHAGGFGKLGQLLLPNRQPQIGKHHKEDDEHIIVGHLYVVGLYLKGCKEGGYHKSPYILAPVSQHNTAYHRRQISQCHHLPYMAGGYNDKEVAAESPYYRAKHSQLAAEVEGTQQDIEAQQVGKDVPHILGQPQMIELAHLVEHLLAVVRRRHLVGRHTAEERVGPTRYLSCALIILRKLSSGTTSGRRVMTIKDAALGVCREEVGKRYYRKQQHYQ